MKQANPQSAETRPPRWSYAALAGVALALFAVYIGVELRRNGMPGFPLDDPWIHLTFARNLARGWGFAYNQGELVQGSTAPLWTLVLAFFHLLFRDPTAMAWVAKLLGAGFLWVAAVYAMRIGLHLTRNQWAGLAAGLALLTLSHFGWAMVSGMEVTLSAALTLVGVYYYVAPRSGRQAFLPWVLFGLAAWTRPECFMFPVFLALDVLLRRRVLRQKVMFWRGLLAWVITILPYFILNLVYAGSLFPNTFAAKTGRTNLFAALVHGDGAQLKLLLLKGPFTYFGGFVVHLWRANPVLTLLAGAGLLVMIVQFFRRRGRVGLLLPMIALLFTPLVGMTSPFVSPSFQSGRYIGNPVALAVVAAVVGAATLLARIRARPVRWAVGGVLGALVAFNAVTTGVAMTRNIAQAESSINRMQVATGKWLAANTPKEATVACNDVGAIGYFADRHLADILGLVTRDVLPYRRKYPAGQEMRGTLDYISDRKPDYLAIFPNWFPDIEKDKSMTPVFAAEVKDNTAAEYDIPPRLRTFAGLLITGVDIDEVPSTTVVFKCNWAER